MTTCFSDHVLACNAQVDLAAVEAEMASLTAPKGCSPDPVTKLWPQHMSPSMRAALAQHSENSPDSSQQPQTMQQTVQEGSKDIVNRLGRYMKSYGYA